MPRCSRISDSLLGRISRSRRRRFVGCQEIGAFGGRADRLGLDEAVYELLGLKVPLIRMPVAPGRNLAILVEVAARNQLLRSGGHHSARRLVDRLEQELGDGETDLDFGEDL